MSPGPQLEEEMGGGGEKGGWGGTRHFEDGRNQRQSADICTSGTRTSRILVCNPEQRSSQASAGSNPAPFKYQHPKSFYR